MFKRNLARLLLIAGGATMMLPMAWMVVTSLKDDQDLGHHPTSWSISLPRKAPSGVLRLDAMFFVTDDFEELSVADFEVEGTVDLTAGANASLSLTRQRWQNERDEIERAKLARAGASAAEATYDFHAAPQTAWRIGFKQPQRFEKLVALNFWLFGDSGGHRLSLRLLTDKGNLATSTPWEVDFTHWRELSCYFREADRLAGMPLLVPEPGQAGAGAGGAAMDLADSIDLRVSAMELTLTEVPHRTALWQKLTANYRRIWDSIPLGRYYWNTLLAALIITVGQVTTSSLAAYAFARLKFPGRDALFYLYLATMMVPADVTMIPLFITVQKLGLFDTLAAVVLPELASAYGTFLLRQFFLTIPSDLEDAAMIDGCGRFGIYWRIFLPLSKPALAVLGVMGFIGAWNMFLWPLIVTSSQDNWLLQVGLSKMQANLWRNYNLWMAGAIIALVPAMIVFTSAQQAFRRGIVLTGMKQ